MAEEFFSINQQNMMALESGLDALASLHDEFSNKTYSEKWMFMFTSDMLFNNYKLHGFIAPLSGETSTWKIRVSARILATEALKIIDDIGNALNKTFDKHLKTITNNPLFLEPLAEESKKFGVFRRVNETRLRRLKAAFGLSSDAKEREKLTLFSPLDPEDIIKLAFEVILWLSSFGKTLTLLISVLRNKPEQPEAKTD